MLLRDEIGSLHVFEGEGEQKSREGVIQPRLKTKSAETIPAHFPYSVLHEKSEGIKQVVAKAKVPG